MKMIAFFCAVFLSMLTVFLVGTGELQRWFPRPDGETTRVTVRNTPNTAQGDNTLHFDFWNVDQGRRNFTISAELPPGGLQDGAQLAHLEKLQLDDGIIEIPLYGAKALQPGDDGKELQELLLEFQRANYKQRGKLTDGSGEVEVVLEDGKGTTNEDTEFFFEILRFRSDPQKPEKNHFLFDSDRPVSIVSPFLEVYSPKGLRGRVDESGIDSIEFLPPVYTYLDARTADELSSRGDTDGTPSRRPRTQPAPNGSSSRAADRWRFCSAASSRPTSQRTSPRPTPATEMPPPPPGSAPPP